MSEPIKVGDLVMVVREHSCNPGKGLGCIFVVERIEPAFHYGCEKCNWPTMDGQPLAYGRAGKYKGYIPLWRLRKSDPPALDEPTDQPEELTA